jgi:hypothetical protein
MALPPGGHQHHGGVNEGFTPYLRTESPHYGGGGGGGGGFHAPGGHMHPHHQHNGGGPAVSPSYAGHGDAVNGRSPYAVSRPRLTLPGAGPQLSGGGAPHLPRGMQARSADSVPAGLQQGGWKARSGLAAPSTLSSSSTPCGGAGSAGGSPYDSPHAATVAAAAMYGGMGSPSRIAPGTSPRGFAAPPGAGGAGRPASPPGRRNTLGQRPQDPAEPMASAVLAAAAAAAAAAARQQNGLADHLPGGHRSVGTPRGGPARPTRHSLSPEMKPSVSQVSSVADAIEPNGLWLNNQMVQKRDYE